MQHYCQFCRRQRDIRLVRVTPHIGMYCNVCNHWLQWVTKRWVAERREQVEVLGDKDNAKGKAAEDKEGDIPNV